MTERNIIDINNLIKEAFLENKVLLLTIIPLFIGYYLQDTLFTRKIAEITNNVPKFVKNMNINNILVVIIPYIISIILFYLSNITMSKTTARIELLTMEKIIANIIESVKSTKSTIDVNEMVLHIKKIGDAKNIYYIIINYILPTLLVALTLIYNICQGDTKYGFYVFCLLAVMIIITIRLELNSINYAYETEHYINKLYDNINEVMTNMDSIVTSNTKEYELKNIRNAKIDTYDMASTSCVNNNNTTYGLQIVSLFTMLSINFMSYKLYSKGKIDNVLFTSIVLLSILFMDYYNSSIHSVSELINSMGRFKEMKKYFANYKIDKTINTRTIDLIVGKGLIEMKNITLDYANKRIFNSFNLIIPNSNVIGLLGSIGSGKSTLLKTLAGLTEYTGDILIDGQNLNNCTYESIVRNIAYIPQHPKLFNNTIYYNVNYGSNYTQDEIYTKLAKYNIQDFINSFPKKLETNVGNEGGKVSGGQRQFIFLIRALIQNKPIILLDEPTSSLDVKYRAIFIDLIKTLKNTENKTIIISTHDKLITQIFDTTVNISK